MNYQELYIIQNKVFNLFEGRSPNCYLTGGTALDRFYLNHRYSEDLDFFFNASETFEKDVQILRDILSKPLHLITDEIIMYKDFIRLWFEEGGAKLKVEFVNDVAYRWGKPIEVKGVLIDTPGNILSNKLTAVVNREEPKDVFDILYLATSYSFNWDAIFAHSIQKAAISEVDVAMKLRSFPVKMLEKVEWLKEETDFHSFQDNLNTLVDDFLFAKDNSLGYDKTPIEEAKPFDFWVAGK